MAATAFDNALPATGVTTPPVGSAAGATDRALATDTTVRASVSTRRIELRGGEPVAMVKPFRRGFFSRVGLNVGAPVAPAEVRPELLQQRVGGLLQP